MKKQSALNFKLELGLRARSALRSRHSPSEPLVGGVPGSARSASCGCFDAFILLLASFFIATTRASCPANPTEYPGNVYAKIPFLHEPSSSGEMAAPLKSDVRSPLEVTPSHLEPSRDPANTQGLHGP